MNITYLIVASPHSIAIRHACEQLQKDIDAGHRVGQVFFYGDSVTIGELDDYPSPLQDLLDIAESHDIALLLCSAGFQKRGLHLSDWAQQDFTFKGLGQFIAESQNAQRLRSFYDGGGNDSTAPPYSDKPPAEPTPMATVAEEYSHLIVLSHPQAPLQSKEFFDIAVVSASYDMTVAVFLHAPVIDYLSDIEDIELQQVFNMMGEFEVPLFSTRDTVLYQQKIATASLTQLFADSRHVLTF